MVIPLGEVNRQGLALIRNCMRGSVTYLYLGREREREREKNCTFTKFLDQITDPHHRVRT